jgi:hypothetical protein
LELRDTYAGTDPDFAAWQVGELINRSDGDAEWRSIIQPLVDREVDVRRLRVVSEPVSDYIRWEHMITDTSSIAAGESVRWVPRRRISDLTLPGNDFWLLDDRVLFNYFSGDGAWVGGEMITEPATREFCLSVFEALWQRGIDHADYMPDHDRAMSTHATRDPSSPTVKSGPATATIDDLLRGAGCRALHLEMRDTYAGTSPDFAAWLAGEPFDRNDGDAEWHAIVKPMIRRGVDIRRARVVSEPVSDYIRFEHAMTPASNLVAGEDVRWVPRLRVASLALTANDFWLVDEEVLFLHFSGSGTLIDTELVTDSAIVDLCLTVFGAIWKRGISHHDYRPE